MCIVCRSLWGFVLVCGMQAGNGSQCSVSWGWVSRTMWTAQHRCWNWTKSSVRTAHALNSWTLSPALEFNYFLQFGSVNDFAAFKLLQMTKKKVTLSIKDKQLTLFVCVWACGLIGEDKWIMVCLFDVSWGCWNKEEEAI